MKENNLPELKLPIKITIKDIDEQYDGGGMCHMDGCCNEAWDEVVITWETVTNKTVITAHICHHHIENIRTKKP